MCGWGSTSIFLNLWPGGGGMKVEPSLKQSSPPFVTGINLLLLYGASRYFSEALERFALRLGALAGLYVLSSSAVGSVGWAACCGLALFCWF